MQSVRSLTVIWIFPVEILCECKSIMREFSAFDLNLFLELMADTEDEAAVEEAFREFIC